MPIFTQYQLLIETKKLNADKWQLAAVLQLNKLAEELVYRNSKKHFFKRSKFIALSGLYFYGRVGRGKTMLMDLFYQHVEIQRKKRIHFHHFMKQIHTQLAELKGCEDPLKTIAKQWASTIDLLCFDEFFISDIGDAMIVGNLLKFLFEYNVILVTTSNCHPTELYRNGLQRFRFEPTIALLLQRCRVISVDGELDYRCLNATEHFRDYNVTRSSSFLLNWFNQITGAMPVEQVIIINNRPISVLGKQGGVLWLTFSALCSGPRSQLDYITIADSYHTVLLSDLPQFAGTFIDSAISGVEDGYQRSTSNQASLMSSDDEARRFIALVDEFYDRNIRLIISAEVDILALYCGQRLSFEFARCQSRLFEMQRRPVFN